MQPMSVSSTEPLAFSVQQMVDHSPQSRSEIYRALKRGDLKAKKLGRRTIILREDYFAYLASLPDYQAAA